MLVNMNAAARHVEMVEAFGLPTTSDTRYEEIFGWYHVMDDTCYWSFHPATKVWDVKVCGEYDPQSCDATVPSLPLWSEQERLELQEKLRSLAFLPQPNVPRKGKWLSRPPFIYEGWLFAWTFNIARDRWQITPIGRP